MMSTDLQLVRDLARHYADLAAKPIQEERRRLWSAHLSLKPTRIPILATYGMWNVWCREVFGDHAMKCQDPFLRGYERHFRMAIFQDSVGDDFILEPWLTAHATQPRGWGNIWGVQEQHDPSGMEGGAWAFHPVIEDWPDIAKLSWPPYQIDEAATRRHVDQVTQAFGDILAINVERGPAANGFLADISTCIAQLRGLEQLMVDMCESPSELHRLLAFMRDGLLAHQNAAEKAGGYSLTTQGNQAMTYADDLERPRPNSGPRPRKALWGFCAAQEMTGVSPAMHDEFMFQYQMPIMRPYGLVHYGCCEDLARKIDMLRQLPNLRSIAVTPRANVARCAEQIGTDYVFSWRPNPTDMICSDWDEPRIRRVLGDGLNASKGCRVHIHLKDIETVQGDPTRLARWVNIVRDMTEQ